MVRVGNGLPDDLVAAADAHHRHAFFVLLDDRVGHFRHLQVLDVVDGVLRSRNHEEIGLGPFDFPFVLVIFDRHFRIHVEDRRVGEVRDVAEADEADFDLAFVLAVPAFSHRILVVDDDPRVRHHAEAGHVEHRVHHINPRL